MSSINNLVVDVLYFGSDFNNSTLSSESKPIKSSTKSFSSLDTDEGKTSFFKKINDEAIEKGYEGIMVKPIDGAYECKRSYGWLKMKPFIEVTLKVVDIEEGTGKNEGITGALLCEGTDEDKFIRVSVGTGLSDDLRNDIWNNSDAVLGQLVEIRADAITISQDSEDVYSLRFPRFKSFRGFEPGEKL